MRELLSELRRRNVFKVAVAYLAAAFIVVQVAELVAGAFTLPPWFEQVVWLLSGLGLPLALVLAWAFDLTPEGVERTETRSAPEGDAPGLGSAVRGGLVAVALLGVTATGGWLFLGDSDEPLDDRSVAVLPFETLGSASDSSGFTAGLHNDLITRLQRISGLTVIARPSVMQYRGPDRPPLPRIAEDLGVSWIVTAAVQQAGGQVQVNPRLVEPVSGTERWSNRFRRKLDADEIFSLQEEITRSITDALETELGAEERERVHSSPTSDLEAYRLYAEGRQRFARRSGTCVSCVGDAARLFRRALARDSSFALAWTGLADVAVLVEEHAVLPDSLVPGIDAEGAARRALELDPDLAEAHASLGAIHLARQDAPAALRELRRAVELKPSYWEAHQWLADLHWQLGERQRSLEHARLAVELNPQHAPARHGLYDAYTATGQPARGLEEARLQQRLGLETTSAVGGEVRALERLGRLDEAEQIAKETIAELEPDDFWNEWFRVYLVGILAQQGDTAEARDYLEQLRDMGAHPGRIGQAYALMGETDRALEAFQRIDPSAFDNRGMTVGGLEQWAKEVPEVRDDPRYQTLLRRVRIAWGLEPDGSLPGGPGTGR